MKYGWKRSCHGMASDVKIVDTSVELDYYSNSNIVTLFYCYFYFSISLFLFLVAIPLVSLVIESSG